MIQFISHAILQEALNDEASIVHFASKDEEAAYEQLDWLLIEQIGNTTESLRLSEGVYQIEDWWPNHLRGIESSPPFCRRELLERLQALLVGELAPWRIVIHYYEGPTNEERGSVLILADRILATVGLKSFLETGK